MISKLLTWLQLFSDWLVGEVGGILTTLRQPVAVFMVLIILSLILASYLPVLGAFVFGFLVGVLTGGTIITMSFKKDGKK